MTPQAHPGDMAINRAMQTPNCTWQQSAQPAIRRFEAAPWQHSRQPPAHISCRPSAHLLQRRASAAACCTTWRAQRACGAAWSTGAARAALVPLARPCCRLLVLLVVLLRCSEALRQRRQVRLVALLAPLEAGGGVRLLGLRGGARGAGYVVRVGGGSRSSEGGSHCSSP